jgi:exodeoxyribonuclease V alpha subunit
MTELNTRYVTLRVTRSAYQSRHGVVFNGVEVDPDTFRKVNSRQHYIVRIEDVDCTSVIPAFKKGMLLDILPKTKLLISMIEGFERFIVTTDTVEVVRPAGQLIVELLGGSSLFKGIGPVKAEKLWEFFGEGLYDLLDKGDHKTLVQKLSPDTAQNAVDAWRNYVNIDAMRYCNLELGLGVSISFRVSGFYLKDTASKLREDPYRLLAFGLSFRECDKLAAKLGHALDSPIRLAAAVEEALYDILNRGSTVATHNELFEPLTKLLSTFSGKPCDGHALASQALQAGYTSENYVLLAEGRYQSNGAFVMESAVAERIAQLVSIPVQLVMTNEQISETIRDYEQTKGFRLTSLQHEAVTRAARHNFFIINGGAGVGKTTVLDALYHVFRQMHIVPIQLALAGKAAKRMTEATGYESFTIARFLRVFDFKKYENTELAFVIDESSMVDLPSMYRLLRVIPQGTRIIMLGDTGQLPPVDFGLVFHELVALEEIPKVTLTEVRRQGENSNIPSVADSIRHGMMPKLDHPDVMHIEAMGFTPIKKLAAQLRLEAPETTQIICPTNKMADAVNELCSADNNSARMRIFVEDFDRYVDTDFRVGDKVMCCTNLYHLDVMNGSVGQVTTAYKELVMVSDGEAEEYASFGRILWDDGIEREVPAEMIDVLKLAYAITIHKSQGSQFSRVIIPLDKSPNLDLTMFYTAVTRAQKEVTLIGDIRTLSDALQKEFSKSRNTDMQQKLCFAMNQCRQDS